MMIVDLIKGETTVLFLRKFGHRLARRAFRKTFNVLLLSATLVGAAHAQQTVYDPSHSIARNWNEVLLTAIRNDFARPTVHARNLFHTSALMYDLWAIFDTTADTYFLGHTVNGYKCRFTQTDLNHFSGITDIDSAREEAISFGMYRLMRHRFGLARGGLVALPRMDQLMTELGYDVSNDRVDFSDGSPAALGNYLAQCVIEYGRRDGANEPDYQNSFYQSVNEPLNPALSGSTGINDPNRWQSLELDVFIDQSGNLTSVPFFLGAEWGSVASFTLEDADLTIYQRDNFDYQVYHDPGPPALLIGAYATPEQYQWNHSLVARWSSHLDPGDGVMCDISPASIGNTSTLPTQRSDYEAFYESVAVGCSVTDQGHELNPATGLPYAPQIVPRGDYTRVLAEFWADGPDSETPPGHWFTIINELVSDHPDFEPRIEGVGPIIGQLEWDVKAYFALGGAMHDAAVAAWGIKGWYDYVRPISAIRYMASLGQSSDPSLPNYNALGIPLRTGEIELVTEGDPLAGGENEHLHKIKLYAWRGPDAIEDEASDTAGVGWILAENWWPYQRPSFVTPPFAGYVSGHSTFSRAAAELLTRLTGNPYFPGGMGEYTAPANEFLIFEDGPSVDITLQWATYRDASDQTSLSRIWGGIHPPVDDIPGRLIGIEVGTDAYAKARSYYNGTEADLESGKSGAGSTSLWLLVVLTLLTGAARPMENP